MSGGTPPDGPGGGPGYAPILGDLEYIDHNWGSAYLPGYADGQYTAVRRDGKGGTLTDPAPEGLLQQIAADYSADPVPRDLP